MSTTTLTRPTQGADLLKTPVPAGRSHRRLSARVILPPNEVVSQMQLVYSKGKRRNHPDGAIYHFACAVDREAVTAVRFDWQGWALLIFDVCGSDPAKDRQRGVLVSPSGDMYTLLLRPSRFCGEGVVIEGFYVMFDSKWTDAAAGIMRQGGES